MFGEDFQNISHGEEPKSVTLPNYYSPLHIWLSSCVIPCKSPARGLSPAAPWLHLRQPPPCSTRVSLGSTRGPGSGAKPLSTASSCSPSLTPPADSYSRLQLSLQQFPPLSSHWRPPIWRAGSPRWLPAWPLTMASLLPWFTLLANCVESPHQCIHFSSQPMEIYVNIIRVPPTIFKHPPPPPPTPIPCPPPPPPPHPPPPTSLQNFTVHRQFRPAPISLIVPEEGKFL